MKVILFLSLLIVVSLWKEIEGKPFSFSSSAPNPYLVQTTLGPVQGGPGSLGSQSSQWLGIPYAAPPLGALRWAPPKFHQPWSAPYQALNWTAGCPQRCNLPPHLCTVVQSEDCLSLNVYAPKGPVKNLPVMV